MIPLIDLREQYKYLQDEIKKVIEDVCWNTNFILGEHVTKFEEAFAQFCESKYCVGVASGTDALYLSLRALGIGEKDEVITAANTFIATVFAISYVGARPILVDISPHTYNIDLDKIEEKITSHTKAIIPVHLYGRPVDMEKLKTLAKKHNLYIIEDACQAHGARFKGKRVGSFGILGCFSFYPGKNLGAYGDGGAIVTSDEELYNKLKMLRNYGSTKKYYHNSIGYNSRLDTLQAAILNVKLKYLNEWNAKRIANAKIYNYRLCGVGDLVLPDIPEDNESHVFHLYVVRTKRRDELFEFLLQNGIQCGIHYPVPIYRQSAYSYLGLSGKDFPVTEQFSKEILSLPMFSELSEKQIDTVVNTIKNFYNKKYD